MEKSQIFPFTSLRAIQRDLLFLAKLIYCSTRLIGGCGAGSPQMLQKRALGRFICPQGQTRNVVKVPELPFIGPLGGTGGTPRGNVCEGCAGAPGEKGDCDGAPNADIPLLPVGDPAVTGGIPDEFCAAAALCGTG